MMTDPPRRRLPRWVTSLVVVSLAAVFLLPGPWRQVEKVGSTVLAPIQMGLSETVNEVGSVFSTVQRVRYHASENAVYRDQLDQLESELVRMYELEVENRDLRNLLGMQARIGPGAMIPVSVIARDDTPYVQGITIDRGANDGIRLDAVVITHKGLWGASKESIRRRPRCASSTTSTARLACASRPTSEQRASCAAN